MKTKIFIIFLLLTSMCYGLEPHNLDLIKQNYQRYYNSGAYQKDQQTIASQAIQYLQARLTTANKKPLAIVLDIDETSLSNYPDMLAMGFGGSDQQVNDAEGKGTDPVIQPTLELYNFAKAHHVAIFFITGRTERYRLATISNLEQAGYKNWDGLILKSENYHENSAAPYKINARQQIVKQGYDVVLSIGDQQSDLSGGYADKTFKMPNPFYFIA